MKIKVIGKDVMERLFREDPRVLDKYNIISINYPGDKATLPGHPNVLTLFFYDASPLDFNDDVQIPEFFNRDHAREIICFLEDMDKDKDLICHCMMGISRSGCVGSFARQLFDLDYNEFCRDNPQIVPNAGILNYLNRTLIQDFPHLLPNR